MVIEDDGQQEKAVSMDTLTDSNLNDGELFRRLSAAIPQVRSLVDPATGYWYNTQFGTKDGGKIEILGALFFGKSLPPGFQELEWATRPEASNWGYSLEKSPDLKTRLALSESDRELLVALATMRASGNKNDILLDRYEQCKKELKPAAFFSWKTVTSLFGLLGKK